MEMRFSVSHFYIKWMRLILVLAKDLIRGITDPERMSISLTINRSSGAIWFPSLDPLTLEQLAVVSAEQISIQHGRKPRILIEWAWSPNRDIPLLKTGYVCSGSRQRKKCLSPSLPLGYLLIFDLTEYHIAVWLPWSVLVSESGCSGLCLKSTKSILGSNKGHTKVNMRSTSSWTIKSG